VSRKVEKLTKHQFELWVFWGVLTLTPKTTVYTGCDILVGTGRIMDLTLDIRFEEMQKISHR
jgi:ATP-dependent RNA helicase RhlE